MKRNRWLYYFTIVGILLFLTACGSAKYTELDNMSSQATISQTNGNIHYSDKYTQETEAEGGNDNDRVAQNENMNRKLIKTVSMDVETEEFDTLLGNVRKRVNELEGYVEAEEINARSYYISNNNRSAFMSIRIPSNQLDNFVKEVSEISNVIWKDENIRDVTLQYVDIESHKMALQIEQERLFELLERAETMEDIITIESRLSEIRYESQNYESQLRVMNNQIEYSTISLHIEEVQKLTPQKEKGAWEKITEGFANSLSDIWQGIQNTTIGFIIYLPYLILWGAIILICILIGRKIYRKKNKIQKKEKEN